MKKLIYFLCFTLALGSLAAQNKTNISFFKGEIIVKIKSKYADKCNKSAIAIPSLYQFTKENKIYQTEKIFPNHKRVKEKTLQNNWVDLSTIYKFYFDENLDPYKIIQQLQKEESIEYAELSYEDQLTYSPSDTANYRQWYLNAIKAYEAWDIEQGDTSVVIAIVDTGSDMDHDDLIDDYAYNYNDPINGIDDDNDGFIDNFRGWDVANNDNNPNLSLGSHGMNCAGIASASTDNTTGISGCGFNTKILTVRIDEEVTGRLIASYQGIVYAADHGAFIINNSWGSNTYSNFSQDIVNYAAINKGALVIGAVGNFGEEKRFYPAAYENILSVGATIEGDTVKAESNFGYWVDIMAPGETMYTTADNNGYNINGGTSMAGPVVAGVAALVKSHFPNYTAEQVKQQLLNSADNIDAINDQKYRNKVGAGRINALKAITQTNLPGIVFENRQISDGGYNLLSSGDVITISGDFVNHLAEATNVNVSIREMGNKVELIESNFSLGTIAAGTSSYIGAKPFKLKIKEGLAINETLEMEVLIVADNYEKKQYFSFIINPDYLTVSENDLTVTLTSNGAIGFSGSNNDLGDGIKLLDGNTLLYEGGFIVGNSANYIPNRFRGDGSNDFDFSILQSIQVDAPLKADFETSALFNDANYSNGGKLKILQKNYFFTNAKNKRSTIYVFALQNTSDQKMEDLYAGMIMDWDIRSYQRNKVDYDSQRKMGISFSTDTALYCGVKVLTEDIGVTHYAIDNTSNSSGGVNTLDGFSDAEKFQVISTNRAKAGQNSAQGNDIMDVNTIGPFSLDPNETKTVSFAVIVASSIGELNIEADANQEMFDSKGLTNLEIPKNIPTTKNIRLYPNPTNTNLNIELTLDEFASLDLEVYDSFGKLVIQQKSKNYFSGVHLIQLNSLQLKTGVYFLEIKNDKFNFQNKFVVAPR